MNFLRSKLVIPPCLILPLMLFGFLLLKSQRSEAMFHGKPESQWIPELEYNDSEQVDLWRSLRFEGIAVLKKLQLNAETIQILEKRRNPMRESMR